MYSCRFHEPETGGRSELPVQSHIMRGVSNEIEDAMDVRENQDKEGRAAVRVTVETWVPLDPDAYAWYIAERTTWLRCEDLLVLHVGDEWSLSPLWCRAPRTKIKLVELFRVPPCFSNVRRLEEIVVRNAKKVLELLRRWI